MNLWQNNDQLVISNKMIPLDFEHAFCKQWSYKNIELHSFNIGPAGALFYEMTVYVTTLVYESFK